MRAGMISAIAMLAGAAALNLHASGAVQTRRQALAGAAAAALTLSAPAAEASYALQQVPSRTQKLSE